MSSAAPKSRAKLFFDCSTFSPDQSDDLISAGFNRFAGHVDNRDSVTFEQLLDRLNFLVYFDRVDVIGVFVADPQTSLAMLPMLDQLDGSNR